MLCVRQQQTQSPPDREILHIMIIRRAVSAQDVAARVYYVISDRESGPYMYSIAADVTKRI